MRGVRLRSPRSDEENPKGSIFASQQLREFERKSRALDAIGEDDSVCFYLQRW